MKSWLYFYAQLNPWLLQTIYPVQFLDNKLVSDEGLLLLLEKTFFVSNYPCCQTSGWQESRELSCWYKSWLWAVPHLLIADSLCIFPFGEQPEQGGGAAQQHGGLQSLVPAILSFSPGCCSFEGSPANSGNGASLEGCLSSWDQTSSLCLGHISWQGTMLVWPGFLSQLPCFRWGIETYSRRQEGGRGCIDGRTGWVLMSLVLLLLTDIENLRGMLLSLAASSEVSFRDLNPVSGPESLFFFPESITLPAIWSLCKRVI